MTRQQELSRELDTRIPYKCAGSLQNDFRYAWWFYRVQGSGFEESCQLALDTIRAKHPEFVPIIRPAARAGMRPLFRESNRLARPAQY